MINFENLEKILQLSFKNKNLLNNALIHRSYLNEHTDENPSSNERLEFLGDAVLELLISKKIFLDFPDLPEGNLTALRSRIVCTKNLFEISSDLGLGNHLFLSKGEEDGGGRRNPTLLANCLEAIIGAIYLDQGIEIAEEFVKNFFYPKIPILINKNLKDSKSLLQEKTQETEKLTPQYKVLKEEGPDHSKTFTIGVFVGPKKLSEAEGKSKQEAEENAASLALEKLV